MVELTRSRAKITALPRNRMDEARDLLELANKGTLDDYHVRKEQGLKSIILFSKSRIDEVLKIPLDSQLREFFDREAATFELTNSLDIKSLDIVLAKEIGRDPNYIVMNRLGPTLAATWTKEVVPDKKEGTAVGRAIGEFVVEFHQKTGSLIHKDIHFQNIARQPKGRYGRFDLDEVGPGDYEKAFVRLAVQQPNVIPAASQRIAELTGTGLDAGKLRRYAEAQWEGQLDQLYAAEKNIKELEKAQQSGSRPQPYAAAPLLKR